MDLDLKWPPEYPKPYFVVPDNMVEAMREAFGDAVEIIPVSETMLPTDSASGGT